MVSIRCQEIVTIWSRFILKKKLSNGYSPEFGEASHIFLINCFWRMWSSLATTTNGHILGNASLASIQNIFGEFGEFSKFEEHIYASLFHVQNTYFVCFKWSTLFSVNSPNSPNLPYFGKFKFGEYHEGSHFGEFESGKSERFPKKAILASTRIRQNWRISGEYSNSLNSLASGHCLGKSLPNSECINTDDKIFFFFLSAVIKECTAQKLIPVILDSSKSTTSQVDKK